MKRRPIKFRGRVCDGHRFNAGEMVYGSLITYKEGLFDRYEIQRVEDGFFVNYPVDEDSIAQFVGYDADGREVYEGDTVIRYDDENEFVECPENGKLCTVIFYTQVVPDLNDYYCLLEEATT